MTKSIYVGNLPWTVKDEDLANKFGEHGDVVSARVITDKMTGRSRGFGFVTMKAQDATKAIAALHQYSWEGRPINVNEAREQKQ